MSRFPRTASGWIERAPLVLGLYALVGGVVSFSGWVVDVPRLTDWDGDGNSIQPNAALAAMFAGAGVLFLATRRFELAAAVGVLVSLVGGTALVELATGLDFGVDDLFLFGREWGRRGVLAPGRMGPPGAVSWTLIGLALTIAGSNAGRRVTPWIAAALPLLSASIASLSIIGYVFGVGAFYTIPTATVIALQTSSFILMSSLGLLLTYRDRGLTALLQDEGPAGTLVRRTIPAVVLLPIAIGFARVTGERLNLYDSAFGTAARTLVEIGVLLWLLWWTAGALLRQSRAREQAEQLVRTNEDRLKTIFETVAVSLWELDMSASRSAIQELRLRGITDVRRHASENPDFVKQAIREIRVLDVNGTTLRMCGAAIKDDLLGPLPMVFGPEAEAVFADALGAIAGGRGYLGAEALLWPLNGAPVYAFMTMALPAYDDPQQRMLLSVFDLTDRKRAEEALRQSETSLREADRRKTELLDTLAHELRNPLAALRSGADLLKRQPNLTAELTWASDVIDRQTALMARLLDQLLHLDVSTDSTARHAVSDEKTAPAVIPAVARPRAASVNGSARRILVVDDNMDAASSLALLLGLAGHETHAAFDGEEAIERAEEVRPDVILLDLGLPKLSGYDVCRQIRERPWGNQVTVIALTGWGQDADRRKTRDAGFDHHIVKPIEHSRLMELLART